MTKMVNSNHDYCYLAVTGAIAIMVLWSMPPAVENYNKLVRNGVYVGRGESPPHDDTTYPSQCTTVIGHSAKLMI